jgi:large subunit ribosomal protein L18e
MVRKTGPTNIFHRRLIDALAKSYRREGAPVWKSASILLSGSRRAKVEVNLSRINRISTAKETILVPGKVLGAGTLEHPVKVAAFDFTDSARDKILGSGGKCLTIGELLEQQPTGKSVRIVG